MTELMGLIYTGDNNDKLRELTAMRAVAAVPVCGRYRIIDFILSSMVSSGARRVGVITQKNYQSLMDHLGSGKEWDLHGKRQGLKILPPFVTTESIGRYEGFLDAIRSNISFLKRSTEKYVAVTDSGILYAAKFDDMLAAHKASGADITLMYADPDKIVRSGTGHCIKVEADGRVTDLEANPITPSYDTTFMDAFIIRRELLIDLVDQSIAHAQYHFTRDLLMNAIKNDRLKVYGWKNPGRAWCMDSIQSYFACSMDLLDPKVRGELFDPERPIWTKLRDEMPTRYTPGATVSNSLVADGCVVEGTVENSILFRGVHVHKGAVVKDSVVMQDGEILSGASVQGCILDKQVVIRGDVKLCAPTSYPMVIGKQTIV